MLFITNHEDLAIVCSHDDTQHGTCSIRGAEFVLIMIIMLFLMPGELFR